MNFSRVSYLFKNTKKEKKVSQKNGKLWKRPATPDEIERELKEHMYWYNANNTGHEKPEEWWREKLKKAEEEGYKNEVCECCAIFLAFHHFTTCRREKCPFSDGTSVLERLLGDS